MVFAVLVAADFYGAKSNFEVLFPAHPTFTEFKCKVEAVLSTESSLRRPRDIPTEPFTVQRMQIYDDKVDLWVDLVSAAQLREGMQVYVFRKETTFHREVQSKIPPPCKSIPVTMVATPPLGAAAATSPPPAATPREESPRRAAASAALAASPLTPDAHYLDAVARASVARAAAADALAAQALYPSPPAMLPVDPALVAAAALPPQPPTFPGVVVDHSPPRAFAGIDVPPVPVVQPLEPSFTDKVRYVFHALEKKSALRSVARDNFREYLGEMRIRFSVETVDELFGKADCNKDGALSFSELTRFGELYPTLLDSLYYRGKEEEELHRREDGVAACRGVVGQIEDRLVRVRRDLHTAGNKVNDHEVRVAEALRSLEIAEDEERQTKAALDAAQADANNSRKEVGVRAQEASLVKEEVHKAEHALADAARVMDQCALKLDAQREVRNKSERRIEELRELIRREEAEVERQRGVERQMEEDLLGAQNERDNRQVEMDARADHLKNKADQLREAERTLADMQDRQRERGVTHLQARDAVLKATGRKCAEERESVNAKEVEAKHRIVEADTEKELQAQRETVAQLDEELAEARRQRLDAERDEEGILDEEVRLRFQRDTLEQEEAALRDQHRTYHTTQGRMGSAAPSHRSPHRATSPYV